ncbi:hypothetical protein Ac2012v2_007489 [Leucoagaricus gongylophorus]
MSAEPNAVQVVRNYAGANSEIIKIKEIALSIVEATRDKGELSDIGLITCDIVARIINGPYATHAVREIEMHLRSIKYLVEEFLQGKGVQEYCSCLARCYRVLSLLGSQNSTRQVGGINEHPEQTSLTRSNAPIGPLNELLGVAAESKGSMVNPQATYHRQVARRLRKARLRGWSDNNIRDVISNVTKDNSLNPSGFGNTFHITYNIHRPE